MIALLTRAIPDRLMPYVITIVRAGTTVDRYGNTVRDWATATRTNTKAWIEQQKVSEDEADRAQLSSTWLLVLPTATDIEGHDRVEYNGETFEVIGPPDVVYTPAGPHHVECQLHWLEG